MTTKHPPAPSHEQRELARLARQIQTLTLELQEPRRRELDTAEVDAKARTLEQLRWRFAATARRTATDDLGNAA
jgi:hypothetical protein